MLPWVFTVLSSPALNTLQLHIYILMTSSNVRHSILSRKIGDFLLALIVDWKPILISHDCCN